MKTTKSSIYYLALTWLIAISCSWWTGEIEAKPASVSQVIQQCPRAGEIEPCTCTVKKNGLDILCEFTDLQHISRAMTVLKGKPSLMISYLKLRHNNLPKLQGFVFLGMDIRHLTIHNSSLAVVEESSLSSIGKYSAIILNITRFRQLKLKRIKQCFPFLFFQEIFYFYYSS